MPSLRTKFPGFPRYGAGMAQSLSVQKSYITRVIGMNPVAYWPLNETSGVTAYDLSGNGLHGTYTNGPTLADIPGPGATMGSAPKFDGINDYVQFPSATLNPFFNPAKGTIAFWFNLSGSWDAALRYMICIGTDDSNRTQIYKNGGVISIYSAWGGNVINWSIAGPAGWAHAALAWDEANSRSTFYLNGTPGTPRVAAGTWVGALTDAYCRLSANNGAGANWNGWLGQVALFSQELTSAQITNLATAV